MKRKALLALTIAVIMALGTVVVFALDYNVPEDAVSLTARFFLVDQDEPSGEFSMVSEDGSLVIGITDYTLIYFEDFVPLSDECDGLTQMVRDVLFGRTLAEVLEGRNLHVIFEDDEKLELVSIMVLFESFVTLPIDIGSDGDYIDVITLPGEIAFEPIPLNGEIVVNNVIIYSEYAPFWCGSCDTVMIPLEVVAVALGYDMGSTDNVTFVPLNFFRNILGQTAYVFEGQVVIETYSDMM